MPRPEYLLASARHRNVVRGSTARCPRRNPARARGIYRSESRTTGGIGLATEDRIWEIIERIGIAMMTTRFGGGLRARPLEARPDRKSGIIWFLSDARSGKDDELEAAADVGLVFIDSAESVYLSITARAQVLHDPAKAAEIWKHTDKVWWPGGPDDPTLRVLQVEPTTAELWDGPSSRLVAAFEFMKAELTGAKPNLGENRKVTVRLR